jgi:hypothetical protein
LAFLLIIPAFLFYRLNSAYANGDWTLDGAIWDGEKCAWLSGAFLVKISANAKTERVKSVLAASPHPALPSEVVSSSNLELVATFSASWDQEYKESYSVSVGGRVLHQLPHFHLLIGSTLYQLRGNLNQRVNQLGEILFTTDKIPLRVKLIIHPPESKSNTAYSRANAWHSVL